jgi:hypothetical protein
MNLDVRNLRLAMLIGLAAAYAGALTYTGGLSFEPVKDEAQFWEQVMSFAKNWPPGVAEIQNYNEPMTPVSFLAGAWLENMFGAGIAAGRVLSFFASLAALALIALRQPAPGQQETAPLLCALGLFAYPYWLPMSMLVYTDTLAALFVVLGFWSYVRDQHIAGLLFLALSIATRQYMVAFPAAVVAYEGLVMLRSKRLSFSRWLPYAFAVATLLGWYAFFGGIGPHDGLHKWPRHTNSLASADPAYSLYFLSAMGAYFVLPERILDRRFRPVDFDFDRITALKILLVVVGFLMFTPDYTEGVGPFNRTLVFVLGDGKAGGFVRVLIHFVLACITVIRFARLDLGTLLIAVNFVLMAFLWTPWEKYCLPVLAALWFLKAAGRLDAPVENAKEASAYST